MTKSHCETGKGIRRAPDGWYPSLEEIYTLSDDRREPVNSDPPMDYWCGELHLPCCLPEADHGALIGRGGDAHRSLKLRMKYMRNSDHFLLRWDAKHDGLIEVNLTKQELLEMADLFRVQAKAMK